MEKKLNLECAKRFKKCLKEAEMTQGELARRTKFTQQYISNIATGKKPMTDRAARLFAKHLHVREDYLLCESNEKTDSEHYTLMLDDFFQKSRAKLSLMDNLHNYLTSTNIEISYLFDDITDFVPSSFQGLHGRITVPLWILEKKGTSELHILNSVNICINDTSVTLPLNKYLTLLKSIDDFAYTNILSLLKSQKRNAENSAFLSGVRMGYKSISSGENPLTELGFDDEHAKLLYKYLKTGSL